MKIDVYQAITAEVEYDYDVPNEELGDDYTQFMVVKMGGVEVHRTQYRPVYDYGDREEQLNDERDRAVGEFAKKLVYAIDNAHYDSMRPIG